MNEALVLLLLASLAINVIAIWRMSATVARATAHSLQISELGKALRRQNSQLERLKEYTASIHYHHDVMERSLRHHLHAGGMVYAPRLWQTYSSIVKADWPFEQKSWPYHLPALDNPDHAMDDAFSLRCHEYWLEHPLVQSYHQQPEQRIDDDHITNLDHMVHKKAEEDEDRTEI